MYDFLEKLEAKNLKGKNIFNSKTKDVIYRILYSSYLKSYLVFSRGLKEEKRKEILEKIKHEIKENNDSIIEIIGEKDQGFYLNIAKELAFMRYENYENSVNNIKRIKLDKKILKKK